MQDLIGDLLDVARIETGTLSVKPMPANVAEMVDDARRRFLGGGGRDNLLVDLAPDRPPVMADGRRIVQVLTNLLSNAAGYSPEGSPIRVTAARDGVHVAVSVSDVGRGLTEDLLPHLFRKFSRIDGGNAGSGVAGSGLGLAICRGIVEAHGGRIRAGERRAGPGRAVHLHGPGGGRARGWRGGSRRSGLRPLSPGVSGQGAHSGGGRRPPGAPVRSRRHLEGGLRAHRDRRPGGRAPPHGGGEAPPGPAGPDAAGERRDRADAPHPEDGGRAGHLRVGVRPGRRYRQGLRYGGGGLRGQALLAGGACGQDQGGAAPAGRAAPGRAVPNPTRWAA